MNNTDKADLIALLTKLADSLRSDKKGDTASFFDGLRRRIEDANDKQQLLIVIGEVGKLAAIAQYGSFSSQQELLLSKVQAAARLLAESNKTG